MLHTSRPSWIDHDPSQYSAMSSLLSLPLPSVHIFCSTSNIKHPQSLVFPFVWVTQFHTIASTLFRSAANSEPCDLSERKYLRNSSIHHLVFAFYVYRFLSLFSIPFLCVIFHMHSYTASVYFIFRFATALCILNSQYFLLTYCLNFLVSLFFLISLFLDYRFVLLQFVWQNRVYVRI